MQYIEKLITRGDKADLTFTLQGDYSGKELYFTAKQSKSPTAVREIDLRNTSAGGGNNELEASYSNGITTITVHLLPTHTEEMTFDKLYYDIEVRDSNDINFVETPIEGELVIVKDVRTPFDNTSAVYGEYVNQAYDRILIASVGPDGLLSELKDYGYNETLSATRVSKGIYNINSPSGIFDSNSFVEILPIEYNSSVLSAMPIINHNYGHDANNLQVGIMDLFTNMVMDSKFLLIVKRIRQ